MLFFPVVAATAFSVLPDSYSAGLVVRNCLHWLHMEGLAAGALLILLLFAAGWTRAYGRNVIGPVLCTTAMLALTAFSQWRILPRMEADQAVFGGDISRVDPHERHRAEFDRLHTASTRVEGGVLAAGVLTIVFLARASARCRSVG